MTETLSKEVAAMWPVLGEALQFATRGGAGWSFLVYDSAEALSRAEPPETVLGAPLGTSEGLKNKNEFALEPALAYAPEHAWGRSSLEVALGGEASSKGHRLSGSGEAGRTIVFRDYRRLANKEMEFEAAMAPFFAAPRFAARASDVLALEPGDAVSMTLAGRLTTKLVLRWSDILTAEIADLATLTWRRDGDDDSENGDADEDTGISLPVGIRTRFSLHASFRAEVSDLFELIFAKADEDSPLRVLLRRSDGRETKTRVSPRVSVSLVGEEAVEEVLDEVVKGLVGAAPSWVRSLVAAADVAALSAIERALLEGVARRLGIPLDLSAASSLYEIKEALEGFRERARKALVAAANSRIQASLEFEYGRIESTESVFEGEIVDQEEFGPLHTRLVLGRLDEAAASPSLATTRFLGRKSFQFERSWGASLSIGPYKLGGAETTRIKEVRRHDRISGLREYSFRGMRSYGGRWVQDRASWKTTLTARSPTARERRRGRTALVSSLYLLMETEEPSTSMEELLSALDLAVLWGIVDAGAAPVEAARIAELVDEAEEVDLSLHLRLGDRALRTVLPALSELSPPALSGALAEAMPRHALHPERHWPASRRQLYSELWRFYLEAETEPEPRDVAALAASLFRRHGLGSLARFEGEYAEPRAGSLAELVRLNHDTRRQWRKLRRGAGELLSLLDREAEAPSAGPDAEGFRRAFASLSAVCGQSHHLKALGAVCRRHLARDPKAWRDARRTLRVGYRIEGERIVENIASK